MTIQVEPSRQDLEQLIRKLAEASGHDDSALMKELLRNLKFLSEKEQELVHSTLRDLCTSGQSLLRDMLWQMDFRHKPVSMEQFLDDPYYFGRIGKDLYRVWREELIYVCNPFSGISEWIFTGSLGVGKTTVALIALLYKGPYWLSCLRNPREYYQVAEGAPINFTLFNATLNRSASVDYTRMINYIDACKYFKENCPRTPVKGYIAFPSMQVTVTEGSRVGHALGCFTGDTKISLLDGTEVPIKDLVGREEFWVYSCTPEGEIKPGRGHSARLTKQDASLVAVTLDNDEVVRCTPDHRFMLRDGTYREAAHLQPGDSLMPRSPGNHKVVSVTPAGHGDVYDITVDTHHNFALSAGIFVHNSDMFGFLMDEANFMREDAEDESAGQAWEVYQQASTRMETRFQRYGHTPGLVCLVSSRTHQSSFLEKHMAEVKNSPRVHISDYSLWEVKGHDIYSKTWFRVSLGDTLYPPEILDTIDEEIDAIVESKPARPGSQIVRVPSSFYRYFVKDIGKALQDIAGLPIRPANSLIQDRLSVIRSCSRPASDHPFKSPIHELPLMGSIEMDQLVDWDKVSYVKDGLPKLLRFPDEPRFIHCDIGLTGDALGIACGCQIDKHSVVEQDPVTNEIREHFLPRVWLDWMLRIRKTPNDQIDIVRVVQFILNLRNHGYRLQRVTFDGFQSAMAIQILRKSGQLPKYQFQHRNMLIKLEADVLSVDRTVVPYMTLREVLLYNCLDAYFYSPFIDEVTGLIHDQEDKKVDHLPGESKDVSDAVCGMVYSIAQNKMFTTADTTAIHGSTKPIIPDDPVMEDMKTMRSPQGEVQGLIAAATPTPHLADKARRAHLGNASLIYKELNNLR